MLKTLPFLFSRVFIRLGVKFCQTFSTFMEIIILFFSLDLILCWIILIVFLTFSRSCIFCYQLLLVILYYFLNMLQLANISFMIFVLIFISNIRLWFFLCYHYQYYVSVFSVFHERDLEVFLKFLDAETITAFWLGSKDLLEFSMKPSGPGGFLME